MNVKRKILVLTRHGQTPKGIAGNSPAYDSITPESVVSLYENVGGSLQDFVEENDIIPEDAFLRHSDKQRTLATGKAILAGAFALQPAPRTQEDLVRMNIEDIDVLEDSRLGYEGTKFNEPEILKDMSLYLDRWFANPDAMKYEGVEITPFNEVIGKGRVALEDSFAQMLGSEKKDLGVLATHASITEALTIAALNSARRTPVKSFNDFGGQFDKEGFATINLDYNSKAGLYEARLFRNGQDYRVDLANLIS
jgi:hypothetical protein